jgi:hypothetical protein
MISTPLERNKTSGVSTADRQVGMAAKVAGAGE